MPIHKQRYHSISIGLHWLVAILVLAMLGIGLYMTELGTSDPLRYSLTQWHKSFGIVTMLLIVWRILWRLAYPAPALPEHLKGWEVRVAATSHVLLYLLMLIIPISGWVMVSASPLDLPTLVFNQFPWPHLPLLDALTNKEVVSQQFRDVHEAAAKLLMLLLAVHIGAALRHRFVLNDGITARMSPMTEGGHWLPGIRSTFGAFLLIVGSLVLYGYSESKPLPLAAGSSQVRFEFTLQNRIQIGSFLDSTVDMVIAGENPLANRLQSTVDTSTVKTGNSQIDGTLRSEDWFDSTHYPQAVFHSQKLTPTGDSSYLVSGILSIKGISQERTFPIDLAQSNGKPVARGSFTIDRLDFNLGRKTQPSDDTVGYHVTITFEFDVL